MTQKNYVTKMLIVFLMFLQYTVVSQNATSYSIGKTYKIKSKVLNEERTYILELPSSYKTGETKYPILVLLDGEMSYHSHSGILNHMTQGRQIPEMIIVAITNVDRNQRLYTNKIFN